MTFTSAARSIWRIVPRYVASVGRKSAVTPTTHASARRPLDDDGISALYVLLLGRMPEGEGAYRERRGRPTGQLITEILGSQEFREQVATPFLAGAQIPHQRLGAAELQQVRAWIREAKIPPPEPAPDLGGLLADFLLAEPAATLVPQMIPQYAARLKRRAASEAAMLPEERVERQREREFVRRLRADLDGLDARVKELETGWRQHVPAFLNAISSVGAFGHEQARLAREIETMRRALDAAREAAD